MIFLQAVDSEAMLQTRVPIQTVVEGPLLKFTLAMTSRIH